MTFHINYADQQRIFNPRKFGHRLIVIGCGGIGASALPTLATLGVPEIELWDADIVVDRNVASTIMFGVNDIGQYKVEVAERELLRLGVSKVTVHQERFDAAKHGDTLSGIVISAVDTMAVRRDIWEAIRWNGRVVYYFDGRIGGETLQLDMVNPTEPEDITWYEQFELFDDTKVAPLPCAQRNIVYPSAVLGGLMASRLACFARDLPTGRKVVMDMQTLKMIKL